MVDLALRAGGTSVPFIYETHFSKELSISNEARDHENRKTQNPGANVTNSGVNGLNGTREFP